MLHFSFADLPPLFPLQDSLFFSSFSRDSLSRRCRLNNNNNNNSFNVTGGLLIYNLFWLFFCLPACAEQLVQSASAAATDFAAAAAASLHAHALGRRRRRWRGFQPALSRALPDRRLSRLPDADAAVPTQSSNVWRRLSDADLHGRGHARLSTHFRLSSDLHRRISRHRQ